MFVHVLDGPSLLHKALQSILDDPTFQTKSPTAFNARIGADHLHRWCCNNENYACVQKFMEDLLGDLNGVLVNPTGKVLHRDKLWESYFYIRSKETFINRWTIFLCSANSPDGSPVLYQHLTDLVFKELLHSKYSIVANDSQINSHLRKRCEMDVLMLEFWQSSDAKSCFGVLQI